jgi:hypothetical protein
MAKKAQKLTALSLNELPEAKMKMIKLYNADET